jgi:hypothetical protein
VFRGVAPVNDRGGLVIGFALRPLEIRRGEKQRPVIIDALRRDGNAVTGVSFREASHGGKGALARLRSVGVVE